MGYGNPPYSTSPVSPLSTQTDASKTTDSYSPGEKAAYYPDEKIVFFEPTTPIEQEKQFIEPDRRPSHAPEVVLRAPSSVFVAGRPLVPVPPPLPPVYANTGLPVRLKQRPFWKRYILWIIVILGLGILIIGLVVGLIGNTENRQTETQNARVVTVRAITNNTLNSVASSGVFLNDGETWNTHILRQNSTGGIHLQVSLDGRRFSREQEVRLDIPPRQGSPLSAAADIDTTGVVYLHLFYISGVNNITMCSITCPERSATCRTISNRNIPTEIPASNFTGLAAVNVNEAQDWRIYYHDVNGTLSELQGDNSGFDVGKRIGGTALNASSIAAVNVNPLTNNINVFYVDSLTSALCSMQFTEGAWTRPSILSKALIEFWNPRSGLGAAYTLSLDQLRVYYTGLDSKIYEFLGLNASQTIYTRWNPDPGHNHLWGDADYIGAPITAVGWNDQARFYQVKGDQLAEGIMNNTIWTEALIDNTGRVA